jgi:hypothetical protein
LIVFSMQIVAPDERRTELLRTLGSILGPTRVENGGNKFAVSNWMNPKLNADGSLTIYIQQASPGADMEVNWLPSSGAAGDVTPLMRLYWPLPEVLHGDWTPPPAIEVA